MYCIHIVSITANTMINIGAKTENDLHVTTVVAVTSANYAD